MTTTRNIEELCERIEQLVQEHIAASRRAAQEAVERAFSASVVEPIAIRTVRRARPAGGGKSKRRQPVEIRALSERLYEAVCAKPGETMSVLREDVGASARDLHRPMTLLKRSGCVRSVGSQHHTRYFPMTKGAVASG